MRVIFCDIDGVLWVYRKGELDPGDALDLGAVSQLNRILEACPDVRIVISSSWRIVHQLEWIRDHFERYGLPYRDRIIDKTPWNGQDQTRGQEIQQWLTAHPDVTDFVILDDERDMDHLMPHLFHTLMSQGLMAGIADEIIHHFDNSEAE